MGATRTTVREGIVYVANKNLLFKDDVTVDGITQFKSNVYAKKFEKRQMNLVFTEHPVIEVLNAQDEPDETLQRHLQRMFERSGVRYEAALKQAFSDILWYGIYICNPIWVQDGAEVTLRAIRRLPPPTFDKKPQGRETYSYLLSGITLSPQTDDGVDQVIEFWQRGPVLNPAPRKLQNDNLIWITDPSSPELAGEPIVNPLIPIFGMLEHLWEMIMLYVGRFGVPPLFIEIEDATQEDVEFAEEVLAGWTEKNGYVLRKGMRAIFPATTNQDGTLAILDVLDRIVVEYASPNSAVAKEGTLIGGSTSNEVELYQSYLKGIHTMLEEGFNQLLQHYLDANLYDGYTAKVTIPLKTADRSDIKLRQAQEGANRRTISPAEHRELLDREGLDDEGMALIAQQWDAIAPPQPSFFGDAYGAGGAEAGAGGDLFAGLPGLAMMQGPQRPELYRALMANAQIKDDPLRQIAADRAYVGIERILQKFEDEIRSAAAQAVASGA